jgi:large subunit ribosomal protein L28
MGRRCVVSGAGPQSGRKYKRRGMIRRKGGAGAKIVGKSLRVIRPNLQRVKIVDENGTVRRVWVSARMIKAGKIQKAGKASLQRANAKKA